MKKINLLLIDCQNDFCMPGASLFINGADTDMHRLSKFITSNPDKINSIYMSLDMHLFDDIAHPMYWKDNNDNHPAPFTQISVEDVKTGIWKTAKLEDSNNAIRYLQNLKIENKFSHTIWPYHCIAGTFGSNIFPPLLTAVKSWMDLTHKSFIAHIKGMDRNSEHFGIFQDENGGKFNGELLTSLFNDNNTILVAGQAKSHCVATSLKQILEKYPEGIKKIILLTDTTSNVAGCEHIADKIYEDLRSAGMKEMTTEEYIQQQLLQTT